MASARHGARRATKLASSASRTTICAAPPLRALALVGCTEAEIASITGHSLRDVRSILNDHYLHRDPGLAQSAIRKLEAAVTERTKRDEQRPTGLPTGL